MTGRPTAGSGADGGVAVAAACVVALGLYAALEKSVVMFASAAAIGLVVYLFRGARMRERIIAIIAAALGGSIGAEIVHTLYHHLGPAGPGGVEGGRFFVSAIRIGLINAAIVVAVVGIVSAWRKRVTDR